MPSFTLLMVGLGALLALVGYLLLLADDKGHVNLHSYRFTGGLGMVVSRCYDGVRDLWAREWSVESRSAVLILGGGVLAGLGVWAS